MQHVNLKEDNRYMCTPEAVDTLNLHGISWDYYDPNTGNHTYPDYEQEYRVFFVDTTGIKSNDEMSSTINDLIENNVLKVIPGDDYNLPRLALVR